eukprot:3196223-Lingulodinium_polyedra.AAC.1
MQTPVLGVRVACARRAMREPLRRQMVDSTGSFCTVSKTVQNGAVESTVCRRSGLRIAVVARAVRTQIGVRM